MSKTVAENRKARFNYHLEDKVEAGLELFGWEVKSARVGTVSLAESFVRFQQGQGQSVEAFLKNAHFSKYKNSPERDQDPTRDRRLLLKRNQIEKMHKAVATKGVTCVVTRIYFTSRGLLKAEIALAKGKKLHDKKQTLKERDLDREARRASEDK